MDPKTGFVIMRDDDLSDTRRRSLDLLYQPLLHPTSYALINLLWRLGEIKSNSLYERPLDELSMYLSIDMKVLDKSLLRIEGAGLLKVFLGEASEHKFYIFHLIQPRSPREFFKDDLLSVGLLEMIGDQRFAQLSQILIPKSESFKDARDLTRNFLEVYTVNHKHLTELPDLVKRIRAGMKAKMHSSLKGDHQLIDEAPDFDFKMMMDIIKHDSYADPKSVYDHKHLILTEHVLYGLDEPAMANYIGRAASVSNNQVNFNKFRLLIAKDFQGNSSEPAKTKYRSSLLKRNGTEPGVTFKQNERMLIKVADYYSPIPFLYHLKKQLNPNGIVTHQEETTLKQALAYSAFRDNRGVINILVYYSLVALKMPTLKSKFMQYMITAWIQAKVNTPADALVEIKTHHKNQAQRWRKYKTKRSRNNFTYRKQPRIKQKLPKWARSDYRVKLHPTDKKLQLKIKKQLSDMDHRPGHKRNDH